MSAAKIFTYALYAISVNFRSFFDGIRVGDAYVPREMLCPYLFHSISICTAAQGLTHPVVPSRFCPAPPAPPDSPPPARRRRPCATPTTSSRGRLGRRTSAPPPRAAVWAGPRAPAPSSRPAGGRPRPRQDFSWCKWVDLLCAGAFF